ncbi:histidine kinase [Halonotius terrestris]|uniref:Histidine kinase n=1 Tax=Halonotius terrestris TaxID=2487750 RepID=A0A8J8PB22_9EURY|nr:DICT sensory domain-containing protein [Halonotius terrestris]TQQ80011.1 histidine kinase [Halonotius terrestris]
MTLRELIADIEAREMTLTAINTPEHVVEDLKEQYSDRNVSITQREVDDEPTRFAILSRQDNFVTAVPITDIYAGSIEPPEEELTTDAASDASDDADDEAKPPAAYREPILDHLEETLFTSYSIKQMFMASREIEDRAWRVGSGELHAGFQTLDVLAGQADAYNQLGTQTDLSVHAYAAPVSETPVVPDTEGFTLHIERDDEIKKTWFVVYDGGGVDENKCALLAEERGSREFYGFWTYDPETVDYLICYLKSTYAHVESGDNVDGDSQPV